MSNTVQVGGFYIGLKITAHGFACSIILASGAQILEQRFTQEARHRDELVAVIGFREPLVGTLDGYMHRANQSRDLPGPAGAMPRVPGAQMGISTLPAVYDIAYQTKASDPFVPSPHPAKLRTLGPGRHGTGAKGAEGIALGPRRHNTGKASRQWERE